MAETTGGVFVNIHDSSVFFSETVHFHRGITGQKWWNVYRVEKGQRHRKSVILSGASAESKDLRTYGTGAVESVRRSFDSLQKSAIFSGRSG